jgi:hypothetical protein
MPGVTYLEANTLHMPNQHDTHDEDENMTDLLEQGTRDRAFVDNAGGSANAIALIDASHGPDPGLACLVSILFSD